MPPAHPSSQDPRRPVAPLPGSLSFDDTDLDPGAATRPSSQRPPSSAYALGSSSAPRPLEGAPLLPSAAPLPTVAGYGGSVAGYAAPSAARASRMASARPRLASRWLRLAAVLLDMVFLSALFFALSLVFPALSAPLPWGGSSSLAAAALTTLVSILPVLVYEVVLTALWGRTLGKMLLGLQVVDECATMSSRWEGLGWGRSLARVSIYLAAVVPVASLLLLVDALCIFGEDRARLADRIAGTRVVTFS